MLEWFHPSRSRSFRGLAGFLAAWSVLGLASRAGAAEPTLEPAPSLGVQVVALELRVLDVGQAVDFLALYGFTAAGPESAEGITVANGSALIDVVKVAHRADIDDRLVANTHINLRVERLTAAVAELKAKAGYEFVGDLHQPFPLGFFAIVKDPSGNTFHLIEPANQPAEGVKRGIFNVGITLPDMVPAREFYRDKLGFSIFSEDYFPPDLPLQRQGIVPLVLHQTAERSAPVGYPHGAGTVVVLGVADLDQAVAGLKARGVRLLEEHPHESPRGRFLAFTDPFGIVFKVRQIEK